MKHIDTERDMNQVNSLAWNKMSLSQLYDQKTIMGQRLFTASQLQHPELYAQIERGMKDLDEYIENKMVDSDKRNRTVIT